MEYQEILSEVALAVNAYYAIKPVSKELCISEDEAKQKILYFISNQNNISIFKEYYRNILGETRSVPSTSACKVIRPYLDEAKQKILYFISNQNNISIFKEYYRNILGETRSVPSTSACKVIRPYLYIEEE